MIQEHHTEFLQLINKPVEGVERDLFDQPKQEMPLAIMWHLLGRKPLSDLKQWGLSSICVRGGKLKGVL